MVDALVVAAGVVLLAVTAWDVVTTVFGPSMGGGRLTRGWNRLASRIAGRLRGHRRIMVWLGPLSAAAATPVWLGLLWLGWDLRALHGSIDRIGQQHLAYPVLRHFRSTAHINALAPRLAALDEALTVMECGVRPGHGPRPRSIRQARAAIDRFLELERRPGARPNAPPPPPPDLAPLRAAGVPVGSTTSRSSPPCTAVRSAAPPCAASSRVTGGPGPR